jgi:hypothetical protein
MSRGRRIRLAIVIEDSWIRSLVAPVVVLRNVSGNKNVTHHFDGFCSVVSMSEKLAVLLEVLWSRWADIASVVWASARLVSRDLRHSPATAKMSRARTRPSPNIFTSH